MTPGCRLIVLEGQSPESVESLSFYLPGTSHASNLAVEYSTLVRLTPRLDACQSLFVVVTQPVENSAGSSNSGFV